MGSRGATDGRERQRPSIGRDTGSHSVDRSVSYRIVLFRH